MLDEIELLELRIFLAVLLAARRETGRNGPVQQYGRAARCSSTTAVSMYAAPLRSAAFREPVHDARRLYGLGDTLPDGLCRRSPRQAGFV
jgi:hypothetical protein